MTPDTSRWRSSPTYDYVDNLVAPDLAWEWLRRNKDYQRDYVAVARPAGERQPMTDRARRRWGLQFLCPSLVQGDRKSHILVGRGRHRHGSARPGTAHPPGRQQSRRFTSRG